MMLIVETRAPSRRLFTVGEYYQMAEAGVIGPDERVELIEGEIIRMSPINEPHASGVIRGEYVLRRFLGDRVLLGLQNPVRLEEYSEPQPDIAVLRFRADFYSSRHPGAGDVLLLVEVSVSSVRFDLERKARLYAQHGIVEYWVEDLVGGALVVHREPTPDGYASVRRLGREDRVRPVSFPDVEIGVAELIG